MSAGKKDMRRADLIVPYRIPEPKSSDTDMSSALASTLPMAAMFLRNKTIGWSAMCFAVQTWLSETEKSKASAKQPAFFGILFALIALVVSYMPQGARGGIQPPATGTTPAMPGPV